MVYTNPPPPLLYLTALVAWRREFGGRGPPASDPPPLSLSGTRPGGSPRGIGGGERINLPTPRFPSASQPFSGSKRWGVRAGPGSHTHCFSGWRRRKRASLSPSRGEPRGREVGDHLHFLSHLNQRWLKRGRSRSHPSSVGGIISGGVGSGDHPLPTPPSNPPPH